mmetsp:Transcript_229/g.436  ORF Transcript_229/g.436 Transcript_229/m.436 type:complete len:244 (+) Transcript_229:1138-1869(+)
MYCTQPASCFASERLGYVRCSAAQDTCAGHRLWRFKIVMAANVATESTPPERLRTTRLASGSLCKAASTSITAGWCAKSEPGSAHCPLPRKTDTVCVSNTRSGGNVAGAGPTATGTCRSASAITASATTRRPASSDSARNRPQSEKPGSSMLFITPRRISAERSIRTGLPVCRKISVRKQICAGEALAAAPRASAANTALKATSSNPLCPRLRGIWSQNIAAATTARSGSWLNTAIITTTPLD